MAKKSRTKARAAAPSETTGESGISPRQPCPCGSGKRYKACHGAAGGAGVYVARPFEGLPGECDLVAMRELVPAASAPLTVTGVDREVVLCSLLPGAAPAMSRESGQVWVGLQVQHDFGDASREVAAALLEAAGAEPGVVGMTTAPGPGPRLQDIVENTSLDVTVHEGFDFWLADVEDKEEYAHALEHANATAQPTVRLTQVEAAYWTRMGEREYLRWVMPEPEDALLDAFARLHVAGTDRVLGESRLIGMFRTHGLVAPVWELPAGTGAEPLEDAAQAFHGRLADALAVTADLSGEERSARHGLANRQVTIR